MDCKRCGKDVPDFLWVDEDHPVLIQGQTMNLYRKDIIENNTVKITAETVVGVQMCKDVNPDPKPEKIFDWTVATEIETAVFEALGAASTCWENLEGAGMFESTRCKQIGDELVEYFRWKGPIF